MLHVVPDARGRWRVLEDASEVPLSEHTSATAAELAAWRHADLHGEAESILVHDRYGRTHAASLHDQALTGGRSAPAPGWHSARRR